MPRSSEDVIRGWYRAVENRDLEQAQALLHEQASFHIAGENPFAGNYLGREHILSDLFRRIWQVVDRIEVTLHDIVSNQEHGVALAERTLHRGPRIFVTRTVTVFHVREGRILEGWAHEFDQRAFDDFVSS